MSDDALIEILSENARLSYTKISEKLNVSETAIRKRVKQLRESGIIKKFTIEVDHKKIGLELIAFIGLDTEPSKYLSTLEKLKEFVEVKRLFTTSGDHMIMLEGWFCDNKGLARFIKILETLEGVTDVCPAIVHQNIK